MNCNFYDVERAMLTKNLDDFTSINLLDQDNKFVTLMSNNDYEVSKLLMDFVHLAMFKRKNKLGI